jgi:N6-adenosine-specific RNA methylase IME4
MAASTQKPCAGDAGLPEILPAGERGEFPPKPKLPILQDGHHELARYDAACRALAEACSVDEVKDIRDQAVAMAVYARQAKNKDLEADAVEIRMRATRRLDQLRQAQKESVGLNRGAAGGGEKAGPRGLLINPRDTRPTLASQGIDKNLAHQGRVLGALPDEKFETVITDARDKVARAVRNAVREVEIEQERESYRARTYEGGTVDDLEALIAAHPNEFRVIVPDFAWEFTTYSGRGKQRSAERYYDTQSLEWNKEFAAKYIPRLAAKDCVFMPWATWPQMPAAIEVITAAGFEYKTVGLFWLKTNKNAEVIKLDGEGLFKGTGYSTGANTEPVLLAKHPDSPLRLDLGVHQVVIAPHPGRGHHSEKPDEVYRRIERLYPGPYLELFARRERKGWKTWGNEIPPRTKTGGAS